MNAFLNDCVDAAAFKFKPLDHYHYPAWQPLLFFLVIGVGGSANGGLFVGGWAEKILFFGGLSVLHSTLLSLFLGFWLKRFGGWSQPRSLFPFLAVSSGVQFLQPLLFWLPKTLIFPMALLLAFYALVVLVRGLAFAIQVKKRFIVLGFLAFSPMMFLVYISMLSQAIAWGWILPPTGLK